MTDTRRAFLGRSLRMAAAVTGTAALASPVLARAAACVDLDALPLSQKNRRRSVGYVDPAPEPSQNCGKCAFFTADAAADRAGCGTCAILNAPVGSSAVCTSFAPKEA